MNITLTAKIRNSKVRDFQELEMAIYRIALEVGRQLMQNALEKLDGELLETRDVQRYRSKGFQKTCIKTMMGPVEYRRRVYVDNAAAESCRCVHLLDEVLGIEKIGLMSPGVCQLAAASVCETTYRRTAEFISGATGQDVSHQAVWNIVQRIGISEEAQVKRHKELAKRHRGAGALLTKILYEENDGIWLNLQGRSRKEYGPSKEMKVGIAYDGVLWENTKSGQRRTLDSKVAYAGFEKADEFRQNKEGLVASRYAVDKIQLRVMNGDGANWIRTRNSPQNIDVLDTFHRNKKITECVHDPEFADLLRTLLWNGEIDRLLECLDAYVNSVMDPAEIESAKELLRYYTENKDSLLGYYERNIPIPETRRPGIIHHARLGSMESNIFTLIGNRMKGRRACWSVEGANHLALLLCMRHTVGFEDLFADLPEIPFEAPDPQETRPVLGAGSVPEKEGRGYEWQCRMTAENASGWLKDFMKHISHRNNF